MPRDAMAVFMVFVEITIWISPSGICLRDMPSASMPYLPRENEEGILKPRLRQLNPAYMRGTLFSRTS
jgi:hypothetical protein